MSENKISKWYQSIIEDPKLLPGVSIIDVLQLIASIIEFKYIITDEIEGFGQEICSLKEKRNHILKFDEIFPLIRDVNQFEWGDFFLFKDYPANWSNPKGELYPSIIAKSDTTIRAVDNQYIYIYTPYDQIIELIRKTYNFEEIKAGFLAVLDYPY